MMISKIYRKSKNVHPLQERMGGDQRKGNDTGTCHLDSHVLHKLNEKVGY